EQGQDAKGATHRPPPLHHSSRAPTGRARCCGLPGAVGAAFAPRHLGAGTFHHTFGVPFDLERVAARRSRGDFVAGGTGEHGHVAEVGVTATRGRLDRRVVFVVFRADM